METLDVCLVCSVRKGQAMIEVVHFQNRWGRKMVAVIRGDDACAFRHRSDLRPFHVDYAERYAAGLEPAFYRLPVPLVHTVAFSIALVELLFEAEA